MTFLSHKGVLAIAAVIDIAQHSPNKLLTARSLAARHALRARHLEPLLQILVRAGILKGVRGPRGGYEIARSAKRITAADILHAIGTLGENGGQRRPGSPLIEKVVAPAVVHAEKVFARQLAQINIEDLVARSRSEG